MMLPRENLTCQANWKSWKQEKVQVVKAGWIPGPGLTMFRTATAVVTAIAVAAPAAAATSAHDMLRPWQLVENTSGQLD